MSRDALSSVEVCAGAGGQALGLENAGFDHEALVDLDPDCCATLALNRPHISVVQADLVSFDGRPFKGIDLLAGGLPCPPFSIAGQQLGEGDERNLFPAALRLVDEIRPRAVMIENVRGMLQASFESYRTAISSSLRKLGYEAHWRLLNASEFGVPQLRPRVVIIALQDDIKDAFEWPKPGQVVSPTVGQALFDLMAARGWRGAKRWAKHANDVAPTLVGGSKKHGGPDLGPVRAKRAWLTLGVDPMALAEDAPPRDFTGMPKLTVRMTARLQGFDDAWQFHGRKNA
jgi:DNA (cytosine-5)-methyltransferase 1